MKKYLLILAVVLATLSAGKGKEDVELVVQSGHTSFVYSTIYSPNNSLILSNSPGVIKVWQAKSGLLLRTFSVEKDIMRTAIFSNDSEYVIAGSDEGKLRIWNIRNGTLSESFCCNRSIVNITISTDDAMMAIQSVNLERTFYASDITNVTISFFDSRDMKLLKQITQEMYVKNSFFVPNRHWYVMPQEKTVNLYDVDKGELFTLGKGDDLYKQVLFSRYGQRAYYLSSNGTLGVWDILTGKQTNTINGISRLISVSNDDHLIVLENVAGKLGVWQAIDWKFVGYLHGSNRASDEHFTFSNNNLYIAATRSIASTPRKILLWGTSKLDLIREIESPTEGGNDGKIRFSEDDRYILASGKKSHHLWQAHTGKPNPQRHTVPIAAFYATRFRGDRRVVTGLQNGSIVAVDLASGNQRFIKITDNSPISSLMISPDGARILIGSLDKSVRFWSTTPEWQERMNIVVGSEVLSAIMTDKEKILITSEADVNIFDSSSKEKIQSFAARGLRGDEAMLSKSGRMVAIPEKEGVAIYDLESKKVLKHLKWSDVAPFSSGTEITEVIDKHSWEREHQITASYFMNSDREIISVGGCVAIWQLATAALPKKFGCDEGVRSGSLSTDDRTLVTYERNKVSLWDIEKSNRVWSSDESERVFHASFSNKNEFVVISSVAGQTLRDARNGNLVATIDYFPQSNSIIRTPDSHYLVRNTDYQYLAFRKGLKAYGFEQFDLRYNRPDIVLERLNPEGDRSAETSEKIARFKQYWKYRVAQNDFTPDQILQANEIHAPEVFAVTVNGVAIDHKDFTGEVTDKKIKLGFSIKDEDTTALKIKGYKIFVNGVPLYGQTMKRADKLKRELTATVEIELSSIADAGGQPGDNKIEISGFTVDGVESYREAVQVRYTGAKKVKPRLYIVSLGIDDYKGAEGFESLTYAVKDAKEIIATFQAAAPGKYDTPKILHYENSEVDRSVIAKIRAELKQTTVDDTVIFFVSGHGVRADTDVATAKKLSDEFGLSYTMGDPAKDKGKNNIYYFMTSRSAAKRPWEKAIPMDGIRAALDQIPARQKLLLIDTCQSGEDPSLVSYSISEKRAKQFDEQLTRSETEAKKKGLKIARKGKFTRKGLVLAMAMAYDMKEMSEMFPELRRGTGTIEIAAAGGAQSALESGDWQNGAFTRAIKDFVTKEKSISVKALRAYVLDKVVEMTAGAQTPMVARDIAGRDWEL